MSDRDLTIRLEVHVEDEDVRGRAIGTAGAPREFRGWLGLIAALDALLGEPPAPA